MFKRRLYYILKPYLPWRLRMMARSTLARRTRSASADVWPINPATAKPPPGWPGWPAGKQFAFVITHDVEGADGLEKIRKLAELEKSLGFCSSFNLIPESGYVVPPDLRNWLTAQGFEVGIHDLHHDGKLFDSAPGFSAKARRINRHLREWGAVGFRAGFMLRNLDWYHELNIEYDASTFDTDPFEPMPDGAGTIFPFWVPTPAESLSGTSAMATSVPVRRGGYVELPYSLPQDSTLFFVLREKSPEIWIRKLDWVAAQGGMALINVHPDYLRFAGESRQPSTFDVEFYAQLLRHVRERYGDRAWQPLPRELASWYCKSGPARATPAPTPGTTVVSPRPTPTLPKGSRAAVVLYSDYPADPRPRRAAEALVEAGIEVDLLCLRQRPEELPFEVVNGVRVHRYSMSRRRSGVVTYLWQYARFSFAAFRFLSARGVFRKLDLIHVHNMPDFLVFAALLPKLRGSRMILDLHDPSPELMETIFGLPARHWVIGLMRRIERWSIGFSDLVLTPNLAFKNLFASRSCAPEKIELVMNSPLPEVFSGPTPLPPGGEGNNEFRVMHHGLIAHRHGVDLLVEAVARLQTRIPGIRLDIYGGETPFLPVVMETAARLGLSERVRYHGEKTQEEIATAIRQCHLGVVPNRRSVFTEINFPTRLFEYLALHRPVIAPNTQGIRDYFGPDEMVYFEPGDVDSLASAIASVHQDGEATRRRVERGARVYEQHLWSEQKATFLRSVERLVAAR